MRFASSSALAISRSETFFRYKTPSTKPISKNTSTAMMLAAIIHTDICGINRSTSFFLSLLMIKGHFEIKGVPHLSHNIIKIHFIDSLALCQAVSAFPEAYYYDL